MGKIDTIAIGSGGFAVSEVAQPMLESADASNVVQLVVQVIIGIATLIGLFKKKSK